MFGIPRIRGMLIFPPLFIRGKLKISTREEASKSQGRLPITSASPAQQALKMPRVPVDDFSCPQNARVT